MVLVMAIFSTTVCADEPADRELTRESIYNTRWGMAPVIMPDMWAIRIDFWAPEPCYSIYLENIETVEVGWGTYSLGGGTDLAFNPEETYEPELINFFEKLFSRFDSVDILPECARRTYDLLEEFTTHPTHATLMQNTSSFNYHEYFEFFKLDVKLYSRDRPVEPGDEFVIDGTPIIVLWDYYVANDNVKVRLGPSTSFEPVELRQFFAYESYSAGQNYINQGDRAFVLGRTRDKVQIGSWFNYWYVIALTRSRYEEYVYADRGWAYAEFLDSDMR